MRLVALFTLIALAFWPTKNVTPVLPPHVEGLVATYQPLAWPVKTGGTSPNLGAKSIAALDVDSGQLIYTKDAGVHLPIASITKLVSALVLLKTHALNETVTVGMLPTYEPADQTMKLVKGQQFKFQDLMRAALIESDDDAIDALATYDSGSLADFSSKMNALMTDWKIEDTHFSNPSGLVDTNNYASATALTKIAALALHSNFIATTVQTKSATIYDLSGRAYNLTSTNQLLNQPGFSGIKTGYTLAAGQSLVALADVNGHRIVTVVLNSPDRFAETLSLVNWIKANYQWLQNQP